jgi:hypothetical protein
MVRRAIVPSGKLLAVVYTAFFSVELVGKLGRFGRPGRQPGAFADWPPDCQIDEDVPPIGFSIARIPVIVPARGFGHSGRRRRGNGATAGPGLVAWTAPDLAFTFAVTALLLLGFLIGGGNCSLRPFENWLADLPWRLDRLSRLLPRRSSRLFEATRTMAGVGMAARASPGCAVCGYPPGEQYPGQASRRSSAGPSQSAGESGRETRAPALLSPGISWCRR